MFGDSLGPQTGSFALTGSDASFKRALRLRCDVSSLTLAGMGINIFPALIAAPGVFSMTGNATTLVWRVMTASPGTFALTGQIANFQLSRFTVDSGGFAVIGNAAGLHRGYRITMGAGTFSLAGIAADLVFTAAGPEFVGHGTVAKVTSGSVSVGLPAGLAEVT
jgi:hypothetical protein